MTKVEITNEMVARVQRTLVRGFYYVSDNCVRTALEAALNQSSEPKYQIIVKAKPGKHPEIRCVLCKNDGDYYAIENVELQSEKSNSVYEGMPAQHFDPSPAFHRRAGDPK